MNRKTGGGGGEKACSTTGSFLSVLSVFFFGFPFGWWGSMSVEEELKRVKERIARLKGNGTPG
ncbi:hypothetical protein [Ammonifex thiophilus]|uniref:hypothetical protein n=1 Tax=Ammonifex thiophilus TaxID=444093 RepID=UPI00106DA596|nr:hypothetical protein [Ammonifex thiophilus]